MTLMGAPLGFDELLHVESQVEREVSNREKLRTLN